jgi:hypothetical protein
MPSLRSYLPERKKKVPVQGRIDHDLYEKMKAQLEKDNLTWGDFVEAASKKYLEESEDKK